MEEITAFVTTEGLSNWVLKPRRSAATDGVFMCTSLEDAREKFEDILSRKTIFGDNNTDALIQEFLVGPEFVVDTVSCDGQHKVVALWKYDKVDVNGSPFVYHNMHLYQTADGHQERSLSEYVFGCLDALGVKWGPCHAEVIWLEDEGVPCLVEVGTRPHGAGGNFPELCDPVIGYNQLDVTLDVLLDPSSFTKIPEIPLEHKGHAIQYFFVGYEDGIFESMDLSFLDTLQSFVGVDMHKKLGAQLIKTVDLCGSPGVVRLVHSDASLVKRENDLLRMQEKQMFKIIPPVPSVKISVSQSEGGESIPGVLSH